MTKLQGKSSLAVLTAGAGLLVIVQAGCNRNCHSRVSYAVSSEVSGTTTTLRAVSLSWPAEYLGEEFLEEHLEVVAVGDGGTVLGRKGRDGPWKAEESGVDGPLFAVSNYNGIHEPYFVAVGADGVILRKDGTQAIWTSVDSEVDADLHGLLISLDRVVVVGDRVILRSVDRGHSWASVQVPDGTGILRAVNHVWARDLEHGVILAVGDSGAALVSEDEALTWTTIDSGTSLDLLAVGRLKDQYHSGLLAVGERGVALRFSFEPTTTFSPVTFFDTEEDLLLSLDGRWIATADGYVYPPEPLGERVYAFDDGEIEPLKLLAIDNGILVGEAGTIIRVIDTSITCQEIY